MVSNIVEVVVAGYHGVVTVKVIEEWYTTIGVICTVSFEKGTKK